MVCIWEPGTWYDLGTVVEYEGEPPSPLPALGTDTYEYAVCLAGHKYKIIQAHQSQV